MSPELMSFAAKRTVAKATKAWTDVTPVYRTRNSLAPRKTIIDQLFIDRRIHGKASGSQEQLSYGNAKRMKKWGNKMRIMAGGKQKGRI
jgi:hypothetical protein